MKVGVLVFSVTVLLVQVGVFAVVAVSEGSGLVEGSEFELFIRPVGGESNRGVELECVWVESFSDALEFFGTADLVNPNWQLVCTNIITTNASRFVWLDEAASNIPVYFYSVASADLDSDFDGLSDARESRLYGTDPERMDTDGDGVADWAELFVYGSNPGLADSDGDEVGDLIELLQGRDLRAGAVREVGASILLNVYHVSGS